MLSHEISIKVPNFNANKGVGLSGHLTLKKIRKRLIAEYITDVRNIVS